MCCRQSPTRGSCSLYEGHRHGLSVCREVLGALKHPSIPLPLGLLPTSPRLGGCGPAGCNPGVPDGRHLPLVCTSVKCNVNLDFPEPVPQLSVPTAVLAVSQKRCRNDSLSPGSHQSSAETWHAGGGASDSSSCKFLKVLCSHFCCF